MEIVLCEQFGGLPFLSDGFLPIRLQTAVACVRQHRARQIGEPILPLAQYLDPPTARAIYSKLMDVHDQHVISPLDKQRDEDCTRARKFVSQVVDGWHPLMFFPIQVYSFDNSDVIGFSNAAIPQHIFLNEICWDAEQELHEQILHETAHVWMYFVEELWAFSSPKAPPTYSLPSGISGKTATSMLRAAFVAAVLAKYYKKRGDCFAKRSEYLLDYCRSCLDPIASDDDLTSIGMQVREAILVSTRSI